jgi:uncharacterized protein (TIGR04255 family)
VAEIQNQNYPRPPITEAVIEVSIAGDATDRDQRRVVQELKKRYPNAQPLQALNVKIDTTGGHVGIEQRPQGYRLSSDDEADVVLVKSQSVATARLAPYPGWTVLRDRARSVWEIWRRFTPHHPISRLGIRYINRIDIPVENRPVIRLEDFLSFYPEIPPIGGGPMLGYIMQATLPLSEAKWAATITSTLVAPSPVPNRASILLDIDVFRSEAIPAKDEDIWGLIDEARGIKNAVFEACITESARGLFRK